MDGNAGQLATQTRSVAQQLEGARAAINAGAPAVDVASRISGAMYGLLVLTQHTGGEGLTFVPGPIVTPDLPVFLRTSAEGSTRVVVQPLGAGGVEGGGGVEEAGGGAGGVPSREDAGAYNGALISLAGGWPAMLAAAAAAVPSARGR